LLCIVFITTPPTDLHTLSLHDALPISKAMRKPLSASKLALYHALLLGSVFAFWYLMTEPLLWSEEAARNTAFFFGKPLIVLQKRSEEHTSELQSHLNLVCRLLLEKKNK